MTRVAWLVWACVGLAACAGDASVTPAAGSQDVAATAEVAIPVTSDTPSVADATPATGETHGDAAGADAAASAETAGLCTPMEKTCSGLDVLICQPDGKTVTLLKTCPADQLCSGGSCACKPQCDGKQCGDDGCGGLCHGCLDIVRDDGAVDTAYGYNGDKTKPSKVLCAARFKLPKPGMTLEQFSAGWMAGLIKLEPPVPFELVWADGAAMTCKQGKETDWFYEVCETTPEKLQTIGTFTPKPNFEPITKAALGTVVIPSETLFIGALFTVTSFPWFTCPIDAQATGGGVDSFMLPLVTDDKGKTTFQASAMKDKDSNPGGFPFRIRVAIP